MGLYGAGITQASLYAVSWLQSLGAVISPPEEAKEILLDIPSLRDDGHLRSGEPVEEALERFPAGAIFYGGNLSLPRKTVDFLEDPFYLAKNAAITADCALELAGPEIRRQWFDLPVLVIGWGRIGKCLAAKLKTLECDVTVAARKAQDRAMLSALGYHTEDIQHLSQSVPHFRVIFNTVPAPVLTEYALGRNPGCLKMDLASVRGLEGPGVVWARGLPGKYAPEASGKLIAETYLRKERPT